MAEARARLLESLALQEEIGNRQGSPVPRHDQQASH